MSLTADHTSKRARNLFQSCRERKVQFRYPGEVHADRDHALCFECCRAERNRRRAQALDTTSTGESLTSAHDCRLNPAQIAHRRKMLQHLGSQVVGTTRIR